MMKFGTIIEFVRTLTIETNHKQYYIDYVLDVLNLNGSEIFYNKSYEVTDFDDIKFFVRELIRDNFGKKRKAINRHNRQLLRFLSLEDHLCYTRKGK